MSYHNSSLKDFTELLIATRGPAFLNLLTADTDEAFEKAFDAILERAIVGLEENKKNFSTLDEEGLSGALTLGLRIPDLLTVTQETNSNGHVDLTIEAKYCVPARYKLGEAKIYNGPEYHLKGLEQLLGRYTTGREGRGLFIIYVRKKDIAGKIKKLRQFMDDDLPMEQQGETKDHVLKWAFISTHLHSSGEELDVGHIGCDLFDEVVR
jgi:hypothetical protein